MNKFSSEVCNRLGYYVYRLLDPRNGQTFYVGKGQGNRVFAHVDYALYSTDMGEYAQQEDDKVSLKVKTIREIYSQGFEVIHIIHRWGLENDKQALIVEAAVVDCYAGLTNIQRGYHADCSATRVEQLQKRFEIEKFEEPNNIKYMIIKTKQSFVEERGSIYNAVKSAWKVSINTVKNYPYVLAVIEGIVQEVFVAEKWKRNTDRPDRYEFEGYVAPSDIQKIFKGKRIPDKYVQKGMSNPIMYSK